MRIRKRLVIDASVLCASGALVRPPDALLTSDDLTPQLCRQVLTGVRKLRYRVVTTALILREWERCRPKKGRLRRQKFASDWLALVGARGAFYVLDVPPDEELRRRIDELDVEEGIRQILRDDIHLIEAALATDRIVISRDAQAWKHFNDAAYRIEVLRSVAWVDPCKAEADCIIWLKNGAKLQEELLLGFEV